MLLYRFLHCGDMPFAIAKLKTRTGSPVSFGIESFFTCSACGAYLVGCRCIGTHGHIESLDKAHLLDSCPEKDEYVNCLKPLINGRGQILAEAALPSAGALYTVTVVTCVLYCGSARHGCCHRARLAQEWI